MDILQATKIGAQAFAEGRGRAPALHPTFTASACAAAREGGVGLVALLDGYLRGWTVAMLADAAPLPDMPSVIALRAILAA
jgi:fructose-specific phosphotransferase system IIC component